VWTRQKQGLAQSSAEPHISEVQALQCTLARTGVDSSSSLFWCSQRRPLGKILGVTNEPLLVNSEHRNCAFNLVFLTERTALQLVRLFSRVTQESLSFVLYQSKRLRGDSCHEEKYPESGHRGKLYHLPVLLQSFDGRIWTFRYGIGRKEYFPPDDRHPFLRKSCQPTIQNRRVRSELQPRLEGDHPWTAIAAQADA